MDNKNTKMYIGSEAVDVGKIVKLTGLLYRALEDEGVLLDVLSAYEGEDPQDCQRSLLRMVREATLEDGNIMKEGAKFLLPLTFPEHVKIDGPVHRTIEKCVLKSGMSVLAFAHTLKDEDYAVFAFTSKDDRLIGDCKKTAFGGDFVEISRHMSAHPIGQEVAIIEELITRHHVENTPHNADNTLGGP